MKTKSQTEKSVAGRGNTAEQINIGLLTVDDALEAYGTLDNGYHEAERKTIEHAMQIVSEHDALIQTMRDVSSALRNQAIECNAGVLKPEKLHALAEQLYNATI